MRPRVRLTERYREGLVRYLSGAGEQALNEAYEAGREAIASGFGMLDMASIHHDAVASLLGDVEATEREESVRRAGAYLLESLSPFEMNYRRADESNAAWRRLNDTLEQEIQRIAHAIHDEAGNILAQASIEFDVATSQLSPDIRERLRLARGLLDETGERMRHLSHELRPTMLDDLGFVPAIEFLAQGIERRTGMRVAVRAERRGRFGAAVEIAAYRIAQEALNNVLRHAGPDVSVSVAIRLDAGVLHCEIGDDGNGFDVDGVLADARKRGLGLLGMRERAAAVGGDCVVRSRPGAGTVVDLRLPVAECAAINSE